MVADAGGPYTIVEGDDLGLDAGGTSAGPTATYGWDLDGDGQFDDATGIAPTVPLATLSGLGLDDGPAGALPVEVEVTEGPTVDTDATSLTIDNAVPTAAVTGTPPVVVAGVAATFDLTATDPSPVDAAATFSYSIDWGDGSPVEVVPGPAATSVTHAYAAAGPFTLSVTATDKDGGVSAPATADVTVEAAPPVVVADAGGPYDIDEGDDLALDAGGTSAGPTATFAWDLDGDGAFDDATGAQPALTAAELVPVGLADGPAGPITITVEVTEGPTVDTATATVTIANVAPVATVDLPPSIVAGVPATVKVGAVDPSPVDAAALFEYRIDWEGDGTFDDIVTGPADPPVTHTYASRRRDRHHGGGGGQGRGGQHADRDPRDGRPGPVAGRTRGAGRARWPRPGAGAGGGTGTGTGAGTGGPGARRLPRTGNDPVTPLTVASVLLVAGAGLAWAGRRRRGAHFPVR